MIEQISKNIDLVNQIKHLKSFGYLTEKEYYKAYHRILDTIIKICEEEQKKCEAEINKL